MKAIIPKPGYSSIELWKAGKLEMLVINDFRVAGPKTLFPKLKKQWIIRNEDLQRAWTNQLHREE